MQNLKDMKYTFNQNVLVRVIGDTTLVYNQENSDMYELNDIGSGILHLLKDSIEIPQIFTQMCQDYGVTEDEIYDDINDFISRMVELKIIDLI